MFTNPGYNGIYCNLRPCAAAQKINEVKNMFLSVILTIAAAYMALQCGLTAFSVPFASWTAARTAGKAAKPPKRRTAATIDPRRARQRDALSGRNCLAYPAPPCAQ